MEVSAELADAEGFRVSVRVDGDRLVVGLDGHLTDGSARLLAWWLADLLDSRAHRTIVIDIGLVSELGEEMLDVLVTLAHRMAGGRLELVAGSAGGAEPLRFAGGRYDEDLGPMLESLAPDDH